MGNTPQAYSRGGRFSLLLRQPQPGKETELVKWRRLLLSLALMGGAIWCLAAVRQVHSQERAVPTASRAPTHLQAHVANGLVTPALAPSTDCGNQS